MLKKLFFFQAKNKLKKQAKRAKKQTKKETSFDVFDAHITIYKYL